MIAALINHLWQSTVFAAAAGALTLAFRNNRAQVRYWLWLSASLKFLVPFSLLLSLGSHFAPRMAVSAMQPAPIASVAMLQIAEPLPPAPPSPQSSAKPRVSVSLEFFCVWACGFVALGAVRFSKYRRLRQVLQTGSRIELPMPVEVRSSSALLEPGVFGLWRPTLLLPENVFDRLTPAQFEAVIAHELCHIRRRDNLTASLHMLVEALFWFYPLIWWIGSRLVDERERACDEAVLSQGNEPRDYAEGILTICKSYLESPLQSFAGVTGADIKKRIHAILTGRVARELNCAKKATLAIAAIVAVTAPFIIGLINASAIRAQSAARPQFEVASLKPNHGCENAPPPSRAVLSPSPGTLDLPCVTLENLIRYAYGTFRDGATINFSQLLLEGGSSWIHSDRYSLTAKGDGPVRTEMLAGPMLRTLLEDRFRLQTHSETRDAPIFILTEAKGGIKVRPLAEGACAPIDLTHPPAPRKPGDPIPSLCGAMLIKPAEKGNIMLELQGSTVTQLVQRLSGFVGRPVIDNTGITGKFDFPLEFAPINPGADPAAEPAPDSGPNIFVALQEQIGFKLSPGKGLVSFLIVDHAEKPSAN